MKTLRLGDKGHVVETLQHALNDKNLTPTLTVDGDFGPNTEHAVEYFQESVGLYDDGIVGRRTWSALGVGNLLFTAEPKFEWVKVPADKFKKGYASFKLRTDVAAKYLKIRERVTAAGGTITSSGGRRTLNAKVHSNRSATSLHYIGRALDLFVYSGMVDPHTDPMVITKDLDRHRGWIVYVRADWGVEMTLLAFTYDMVEVETTGRFINLTELFAEYGFKGIRARKSFLHSGPDVNNGAAEWWHFQDETGLERGVTRFGDELLLMYSSSAVNGTPPWDYRDRTFKNGYF